mmetsp:Transcript_4448/g.5155  ORF Transcript_4448/g.5155 Transcript_4448/m.5155 type:complete len:237 (-) Transcript_4448:290-1000(-)
MLLLHLLDHFFRFLFLLLLPLQPRLNRRLRVHICRRDIHQLLVINPQFLLLRCRSIKHPREQVQDSRSFFIVFLLVYSVQARVQCELLWGEPGGFLREGGLWFGCWLHRLGLKCWEGRHGLGLATEVELAGAHHALSIFLPGHVEPPTLWLHVDWIHCKIRMKFLVWCWGGLIMNPPYPLSKPSRLHPVLMPCCTSCKVLFLPFCLPLLLPLVDLLAIEWVWRRGCKDLWLEVDGW